MNIIQTIASKLIEPFQDCRGKMSMGRFATAGIVATVLWGWAHVIHATGQWVPLDPSSTALLVGAMAVHGIKSVNETKPKA